MPTYMITDPSTGQKLKLTGDSPPTEAELEQIFASQIQPEPEGFAGAGVVEPAATIGTSIVAEPLAGLAGLMSTIAPVGGALSPEAQAFAEPSEFTAPGADVGAKVVGATKEALTFQPRTEKGQASLQAVGEFFQPLGEAISGAEQFLGEKTFEATESPAAAAAATTLPTAILEALSGFGGHALRNMARTKTFKAQQAIKALDDAEKGIITDRGLSDVADVLKKGDAEDIAAIIDADPNFYRAADELGITTEPLAGFASRNPQFRDVEAALRSVPGSALDPQARAFIGELSQKADDLIQQYGGTLDKAQLGIDFKDQALKSIDDLSGQADDIYGQIAEQLPRAQRFPANETVDFLLTKADELGGVEELPSKLKTMLKQLRPADGNPTLGKIDQLRREIGQALKGSGEFKDVESGLNKALYARLTKDQDAIAQASGLDTLTDTAKGLIRQRKQLEDNLVTLLGKDLNKSLNVSVVGAVKGLPKGQIDQFKKVVEAIPESQRQSVVLSAMNDIFKGSGVGQTQLSPTQFVKWFETLQRSPAAKDILFKNLPKDSRKALESLYRVSKGVSQSLQQTTPTGRINALFNPDTGIIRKMVGGVATRGLAFATGSPVSAAMTNATVDFLRQSSNPAKRASDLMLSPQFQELIRQSVKEGVIDGNKASAKLLAAEKSLQRSKQFQRWADTLGKPDRAALEGGILSYLFKEEDRENPDNNITPILNRGKSPQIEVAGRQGRFNFDVPPVFFEGVGGGKSPLYEFESNQGETFKFRLESGKQGGRWEEGKHFNEEMNAIRSDPSNAIQFWGQTPLANFLIRSALEGRSNEQIKKELKTFNTHRQISGD